MVILTIAIHKLFIILLYSKKYVTGFVHGLPFIWAQVLAVEQRPPRDSRPSWR